MNTDGFPSFQIPGSKSLSARFSSPTVLVFSHLATAAAVLGPHPGQLGAYSCWLCAQASLLAGLGGPYEVPESELGSVVCMATAHSAISSAALSYPIFEVSYLIPTMVLNLIGGIYLERNVVSKIVPHPLGGKDSIAGRALVLPVLTRVLSLAPRMILRASPGVIREHKAGVSPEHGRVRPFPSKNKKQTQNPTKTKFLAQTTQSVGTAPG